MATRKRKSTENHPVVVKKRKTTVTQPTEPLPADIWCTVREHVNSFTTTVTLRLVCRMLAKMFTLEHWTQSPVESNDLEVPLRVAFRTGGEDVLYQLKFSGYHGKKIFRDISHQQMQHLYSKLDAPGKAQLFPFTCDDEFGRENNSLACARTPFDDSSYETFGNKHYLFCPIDGERFLFLEFSGRTIKSHQWRIESSNEVCYNRLTVTQKDGEFEGNESSGYMLITQQGLFMLVCASSVFFFDPSKEQTAGYAYFPEGTSGFDALRLEKTPAPRFVYENDGATYVYPYPKLDTDPVVTVLYREQDQKTKLVAPLNRNCTRINSLFHYLQNLCALTGLLVHGFVRCRSMLSGRCAKKTPCPR